MAGPRLLRTLLHRVLGGDPAGARAVVAAVAVALAVQRPLLLPRDAPPVGLAVTELAVQLAGMAEVARRAALGALRVILAVVAARVSGGAAEAGPPSRLAVLSLPGAAAVPGLTAESAATAGAAGLRVAPPDVGAVQGDAGRLGTVPPDALERAVDGGAVLAHVEAAARRTGVGVAEEAEMEVRLIVGAETVAVAMIGARRPVPAECAVLPLIEVASMVAAVVAAGVAGGEVAITVTLAAVIAVASEGAVLGAAPRVPVLDGAAAPHAEGVPLPVVALLGEAPLPPLEPAAGEPRVPTEEVVTAPSLPRVLAAGVVGAPLAVDAPAVLEAEAVPAVPSHTLLPPLRTGEAAVVPPP